MSFPTILLAPLVVMLPAASAIEPRVDVSAEAVTIEEPAPAEFHAAPAADADVSERSPFALVVENFRPADANQVRIEQRVTIRISPQSAPVRPNLLMDLPSRELGSRLTERKIGKCLPVAGIAGVQATGDNRLLLFMRDQRVVSADLERACRARDFYSGFYLSRSSDGRICVDRDALLSRSGANCKLTRIRQLVDSGN